MVNDKKPKRITPLAASLAFQIAGFDCTEAKIRRWCRNKMLKRAKKVGGQWYVDEDEIREMLQ